MKTAFNVAAQILSIAPPVLALVGLGVYLNSRFTGDMGIFSPTWAYASAVIAVGCAPFGRLGAHGCEVFLVPFCLCHHALYAKSHARERGLGGNNRHDSDQNAKKCSRRP